MFQTMNFLNVKSSGYMSLVRLVMVDTTPQKVVTVPCYTTTTKS